MNKNKIATEFIKSLNENPYEMYRLIHEIDIAVVRFIYEYSSGLSENVCPHISKADLFNTAMLTGYLLRDHIRRAELDELKDRGLH